MPLLRQELKQWANRGGEMSRVERALMDLMNEVRTGYAEDCLVEEFGESRLYR